MHSAERRAGQSDSQARAVSETAMEPDESDPFVDLSRALAVPAVELILFEMLPLGDRSAQELYHSICQFDNDMVRALLKDRPELTNECRSRVKFQQKVNIEEESNTHTIELDDATPLHVATAVTNAEIIRDLLRAGANPVQPFTTFRAWINKASEATKPDVAMAGGVALHLGVLLDSYLCVRELASPDLYYARVRRLLLAPQPIGQSFCTAGMLDFLDWPLREMIVDNQFHLGGASPLQLASLLSSKGMIRQVILRYLQYYTMKYYLVRHEVPFTKFKNQLRFASDDTGVLDEIERGYALHLCLSMRSKESTATLIEFDDIYEIFVSCIYHRLEVAQKFLAECEAQGVQPDIAKLNEYLRLPGDKDLLPTGMERHDDAEFVNLWHRVVLPTVREVWTEMVEGTAFDLRRLGKPMRLESKADFAQHRARIRYWNENLTVFRSPVVVHQVSQDYAFQRDLGFYLTRLNKPDLVYMEGGNERRPLDYPVITGDIRTAKVLLSRGAKCTYIQNLWKMKDNDIVRATMTQPHWEEYYMDRANPCALFDNEPELVMAVMDRFVQVKKTTQDEDSNSQFEKIVLNYKFFDAELKQPRKEGVPHPILTLVRRNLTSMLMHPLVYRYIHRVFPAVFFLYLLLFLTYFAFNILFTGHLINVSMIKEQNDASEYKKCLESGSNMTVHDMTWYKQNRFWTVGVVGYLKGFVIFFLIKEMLQLVVRKLDYFGLGNMIDLFVFVSILVLLHSHEHSAGCQYYSDSQWQLAAVVLFFTWFNVFLYFRKFPVFGVYIVMFLVILQNSVKFLFLFSVLVFAFAAQFHILMGNQLRFSNYWDACLKVFVMGTGELTFEEIFLEDQNSSSTLVAYDALSRAVFILFIVIIGIVTMNLLVGLAVDDISQIQRRAQLKRLALQADLSISILSRLYEFRRKFIKWWRERDEANILQLVLLFAFSAFLLPLLTVMLVFIAILLVLSFFRHLQHKKDHYFRVYTQRHIHEWYSVLCAGLIKTVFNINSEEDFREQIVEMKARKKTLKYYTEDSDSDEEEMQQIEHLKQSVSRVETKLDLLLQQQRSAAAAAAAAAATGAPNASLYSRQASAYPGQPQQPQPGTDRGQHALLSLVSEAKQQSTLDQLNSLARAEESEEHLLPFHRFRRVTMRQRRLRDSRKHFELNIMDETDGDGGADRGSELGGVGSDDGKRHELHEALDYVEEEEEQAAAETGASSSVEVHLLPKSRTHGRD